METQNQPDKPTKRAAALTARLEEELKKADETHIAGGIGRTMKARVPMKLIEAAKARTGIASDEDLVKAALVHLALDADGDVQS